MKGKLKIIIMVALAGVSFAASFFINKLTTGGDGAPQASPDETREAKGLRAPSDMSVPSGVSWPTVQMKEREFDRLVKELRLKIDAVSAREDEIEKRQQRLKLAEKMLQKQAEELENLRVRLVAPLTNLREQRAKLLNTRVTIKKQEQDELKHTARIYESMEPTKGGAIFTSMCKNDQEDDVVKILYFMSERTAAKMLAAITDTDLAAKLCEKLKRVSRQQEG